MSHIWITALVDNMITTTHNGYTCRIHHAVGKKRLTGHEIRRLSARIHAMALNRAQSAMSSGKSATRVELSSNQATGVMGTKAEVKMPYKRIAPMTPELWDRAKETAVYAAGGCGVVAAMVGIPVEYSIVVALVAGGGALSWSLDRINLALIEEVVGVDLDGDGFVGEPQEPILDNVWIFGESYGENTTRVAWGLTQRQTRALLERMRGNSGHWSKREYMTSGCPHDRFTVINRTMIESGAATSKNKLTEFGFLALNNIATGKHQ